MTKSPLESFKLITQPTVDIHSACCDLWELAQVYGPLTAEFNGVMINTKHGFPSAMAEAWHEEHQRILSEIDSTP